MIEPLEPLKVILIEEERAYETVFLLKPTLSEEQYKAKVEEYVQWLKDQGAEIVHVEHWGIRKTAYPIQKFHSAYYALIEFRALQKVAPALNKKFRYDDDVIRDLIVRLDKHAVAFNERRRKKLAEKGTLSEPPAPKIQDDDLDFEDEI